MKARLGFSVAVHTKPEILIIDEVLGTGDKRFQEKARNKMKEFLTSAKGIVIVSHNMKYISTFCDYCIWLNEGKVRTIGPAAEVVAAYSQV